MRKLNSLAVKATGRHALYIKCRFERCILSNPTWYREPWKKAAFTVPRRPVCHFWSCLLVCVTQDTGQWSVIVYSSNCVFKRFSYSNLGILELVAELLFNAKLKINGYKSKFCFREFGYVGYIVGKGEFRPDPVKIWSILDFPYQRMLRQVSEVMGTTEWYRRFITNYNTIATTQHRFSR